MSVTVDHDQWLMRSSSIPLNPIFWLQTLSPLWLCSFVVDFFVVDQQLAWQSHFWLSLHPFVVTNVSFKAAKIGYAFGGGGVKLRLKLLFFFLFLKTGNFSTSTAWENSRANKSFHVVLAV